MLDTSRVEMDKSGVVQSFAELISEDGKRKHIGCVMGLGNGWVEVSLPECLNLPAEISVRFLPSRESVQVLEESRALDRARFVYRTA